MALCPWLHPLCCELGTLVQVSVTQCSYRWIKYSDSSVNQASSLSSSNTWSQPQHHFISVGWGKGTITVAMGNLWLSYLIVGVVWPYSYLVLGRTAVGLPKLMTWCVCRTHTVMDTSDHTVIWCLMGRWSVLLVPNSFPEVALWMVYSFVLEMACFFLSPNPMSLWFVPGIW